MTKLVTISVVSHGQIDLIVKLFDDIATYLSLDQLEVILTLNLPETVPFLESDYAFLKMIIRNKNSKGGNDKTTATTTAKTECIKTRRIWWFLSFLYKN